MKRTLMIVVAATFLVTTLGSCKRDLCAAYTKEYKIQKKKEADRELDS